MCQGGVGDAHLEELREGGVEGRGGVQLTLRLHERNRLPVVPRQVPVDAHRARLCLEK